VGDGFELYFARGMTTGPVNLQSSANLQTWSTIAAGITNPHLIPANGGTGSFFKLVSP